MRTAHVKFADSQYNYSTAINGTDQEIRDYFVGQLLNLGHGDGDDNMHRVIGVEVD